MVRTDRRKVESEYWLIAPTACCPYCGRPMQVGMKISQVASRKAAARNLPMRIRDVAAKEEQHEQ